ncbi:hypothetical protein AKO1_008269 [Acrasis kona]|uniref:Phytanoyl-CoA dioxygenase n=1 Tax=Acrasis kona TaxID=1008807 RepID=A0AAW2YNI2_9EUKA
MWRFFTSRSTPTSDKILAVSLSAIGITSIGYTALSVYIENPNNIPDTSIALKNLEAHSNEEAIQLVNKYGACVLSHKKMSNDLASEWRETCRKQFRRYELNPTPSWMGDQSFKPVLKNRFHMNLMNKEEMIVQFIPTLTAELQPLADLYFQKESIDSNIEVSDAQIVISKPKSKNQFWHKDNTRPGVTFHLMLQDVPLDLGPSQLITNTQIDNSATEQSQVINGVLKKGDILFYDSRLWHRTLRNNSEEDKIELVLRYDYKKTPPPGESVFGAIWGRMKGQAEYSYLYIKNKIN